MPKVLEMLYRSEINARLQWQWDGGFEVALLAGYSNDEIVWEGGHNDLDVALAKLGDAATKHYPNSAFAVWWLAAARSEKECDDLTSLAETPEEQAWREEREGRSAAPSGAGETTYDEATISARQDVHSTSPAGHVDRSETPLTEPKRYDSVLGEDCAETGHCGACMVWTPGETKEYVTSEDYDALRSRLREALEKIEQWRKVTAKQTGVHYVDAFYSAAQQEEIGLDREFMAQITRAAYQGRYKHVPPQFMVNDLVAEICDWLQDEATHD